jgi:NADH:ubiquinone reductase (H+-translocating)
MDETRHVVIVGGGFAGLGCALRLARNADLHITLIDKHNYHQFQPLLYQVATGEAAASEVATGLRRWFRRRTNVDVKLGEVTAVDPTARRVTLASGQTVQGDFLVLAAGSQPNFFHTPGAEHSYPLYSLEDAQRLRSRILALFEAADRDPSLLDRGALNFLIVGAGPTGVETAGALADLISKVMPYEYRDLTVQQARVILVELTGTVLPPYTEKSRTYAAEVLQRRGLELRLNTSVKEIHTDRVLLSDGTTIPTLCVIWSGGLKAAPLAASTGLTQGRGGRIDVQPDLRVPGHPGGVRAGGLRQPAGRGRNIVPAAAGVGGAAGGAVGGPQHQEGAPRQAAKAVHLLRQGDLGDDRPQRGDRRAWPAPRGGARSPGVRDVAGRARLAAGRQLRPPGGHDRLELGLCREQPGRPGPGPQRRHLDRN